MLVVLTLWGYRGLDASEARTTAEPRSTTAGDRTNNMRQPVAEWLSDFDREVDCLSSTLGSATSVWTDSASTVEDAGLLFNASVTVDGSRSLRGGIRTNRSIFRHLFDANLTIDAEKLWGWRGATLFFDFQTFNGRTGDQIVGDYQIFSNIDTRPVTQVPELWMQQRWDDIGVRIKAGMVDANSEFAAPRHGSEFLSSSMGFSPTIFVLPTYPDPATSLNVFWEPHHIFTIGVGVYDGAGQRGVPTGSRGPRTLIGERLFTIGETQVRWKLSGGRNGRVALGAWHHNGRFESFDRGTQRGTSGWYAVLDQQIWVEQADEDGDDQGLGLFLQVGRAEERVSEVGTHLGAGLAWRGGLPTRDDDTLGVGCSWVRFSSEQDDLRGSETSGEVFYRFALTKWADLTIDLQYIRHPGGIRGRRDALVATSRLKLQF